MILKKPYGFLIRHFQKIHWLILLLCAYLFYKNSQLSSFVNDYLQLGVYDQALDGITNYVNIPFYIVIILIFIISIFIMSLLRYKKKPYRFYIFLFLEYLFMFGIFIYTKDFFLNLTAAVKVTTALAIRDLISIASLPQYVIFIVVLLRALGINLKSFGFEDEKDRIAVEEKDNEEFEVQVNVDKDKYKRKLNKSIRLLKYFYIEHKIVIQIIASIVLIVGIGYTTYYFKVVNRVYKMNDVFSANGYSVQVQDGYITDKDMSGNLVLDKNSNKKFVILKIKVVNHGSSREMNMDRFHVLNKLSRSNYTTNYNNSFMDLGMPYEKTTLKANEEKTFLLIFMTDKKLENNKFVLTYQDVNGSKKLKKVKLSLTDVTEIKEEANHKLNEDITLLINKEKKTIRFEEATFVKEQLYYYPNCYINDCPIASSTVTAPDGKSILVLSYLTDDFTTKELVDFCKRYGTINYIDNKDSKTVKATMALSRTYQGNYLYLLLPQEVENSKNVDLLFTIRDKRYIYRLK